MKLRTSFVHPHRTAVERLSIQRSNSGPGFSRQRHLDKSDTAGLARVPVHDDHHAFDGSMGCKNFSQLLLRDRDIKVPDENVGHEFTPAIDLPECVVWRQKRNFEKAILRDRLIAGSTSLERLDVLCLPALRTLRHLKLHRLAFLQALETSRLDCRKMHKNVFATLTADEAVAFGVVEPLYCSLFCHVDTVFLSIGLRWRDSEVLKGRLLAVEARAAHDRFGLTHTGILREARTIRKANRVLQRRTGTWPTLTSGTTVAEPMIVFLTVASSACSRQTAYTETT